MGALDQIKENRVKSVAGAALLATAAYFLIDTCDLDSDLRSDSPFRSVQSTRIVSDSDNARLDASPEGSTSLEKTQHSIADKLRDCIQGEAARNNVQADCRLNEQTVLFPHSDATYKFRTVDCVSYDEEGHPNGRSFVYIGPVCDPENIYCSQPEDVVYAALSTFEPLNWYVDLNLPRLGSSYACEGIDGDDCSGLNISSFADDISALESEVDTVCSSAFEMLNFSTPITDRANQLSRALDDLEAVFSRSGFKFKPLTDRDLFTASDSAYLYGSSDGNIPIECSFSSDNGDYNVSCGLYYFGFLNENGLYISSDLEASDLADDKCEFSSISLDSLQGNSSYMNGVAGCSSGYNFYIDEIPEDADESTIATKCDYLETHSREIGNGTFVFFDDEARDSYEVCKE